MNKYRFKTEKEFKADGRWEDEYNQPYNWCEYGSMNDYLGQPIPDKYNHCIESSEAFVMDDWTFDPEDCIRHALTEEETEEILNQIKKSLIKEKMNTESKTKSRATKKVSSVGQKFVFMDKTVNVLNVGFQTSKNVILYGPGGHGKSEITLDFLRAKGIEPFIQTMGTGMTTDRLFGGLNIPVFEKTGKIEYLVENSFMNHEYVIFEELFDAPDFILEQLKDILSSGVFRNGTQIFPINTKFIICCTNRTRDEFSKNMSLKALMERFPLELNVIWDNYTEISYNKLLESKFGVDNVDPVIPYLLQEYSRNGITISPRVAVTAYQIYDECGPDALCFIAEFSKKPSLIAEAIKKFESTIKFRELSSGITECIEKLNGLGIESKEAEKEYKATLKSLEHQVTDIKGLTVNDDVANVHAQLVKASMQAIEKFKKTLTIASFV